MYQVLLLLNPVDRESSGGSDVMDEKPVPLQRRPRKDSDVRIRYSILQRPSIPECLVLGFQVTHCIMRAVSAVPR